MIIINHSNQVPKEKSNIQIEIFTMASLFASLLNK